MPVKEILPGTPFDKLTVICRSPSHITPNGTIKTRWRCSCECGSVIDVDSQKLRRKHTKSCGCDKPRMCAEANVTHGNARIGKHTRTYRIWNAMWTRCTNPHQKHWKHYGGRGITVCERWKSFENFYSDMGECPPKLTIERRNTNGNYEPSNCSWQSYKSQARNKRSNKMITVHGVTACMAEHCERYGIDRRVVEHRLARSWSIEKAFTFPIRGTQAAKPASQPPND